MGVLCLVLGLFCSACFAIIKRADCFTLIVLLMFGGCLCSLALFTVPVGWSAVYDSDIF